jgi:hypothetical protein
MRTFLEAVQLASCDGTCASGHGIALLLAGER